MLYLFPLIKRKDIQANKAKTSEQRMIKSQLRAVKSDTQDITDY